MKNAAKKVDRIHMNVSHLSLAASLRSKYLSNCSRSTESLESSCAGLILVPEMPTEAPQMPNRKPVSADAMPIIQLNNNPIEIEAMIVRINLGLISRR